MFDARPQAKEIRSQKSFDLSKILDEIDKFEFVKTLHRAQSTKAASHALLPGIAQLPRAVLRTPRSVVKAASEKAAAAPSINEELLIPM